MRKLPAKVHQKGPSLYYVHKNQWTRLCGAGETDDVMHGELWKVLRKTLDTLEAVMDDYLVVRLPKLAIRTQENYALIIKNRLKQTFGHMHPSDLTSQDVAVYLEMRERAGHGAAGNYEMSVLSSVYNHGMRVRACSFNPTYGVRRNTEKPRTYYITDESLGLALRNAKPSLRHVMWAAYLTGFRQGDLRNLTREHITPEGIKVIQSKDGKHEMRLWSDSLRKVVRRAMARSRSPYVFTNESGQHMTRSAISCAMRKLKAATGIDWRFHDLRAKAESDHNTGLGLMRRYARARKLHAVK